MKLPAGLTSNHTLLALFVSATVIFFIWASIGTLDVVTMTQGEVVPASQLQKVQHLEGGIVEAILVQEGQRVAKGETLVELEATASDADLSELRLRIASLKVDLLRLEAERQAKAKLEINLEGADPLVVDQAMALFNARRQLLNTQVSDQEQVIAMRKLDMQSLETKGERLAERLVLVQEQIAISESLLKDNLTNRYQHVELLKEANGLQSSIDEAESALAVSKLAISESELKKQALKSIYDEEVNTTLGQTRRQKEELEQRLRKAEDELSRRSIKAPMSGVVKSLYITTKGEILRSGMTVLDVVPEGDHLLIEAKVPIADIGYVKTEQQAQLRLTTSNARKYGNINGSVEKISPDTIVDEKGQPYYKAVIRPEVIIFDGGDEEYPFIPGMMLSVQILTGERTVLEYLISPFMRNFGSALKER